MASLHLMATMAQRSHVDILRQKWETPSHCWLLRHFPCSACVFSWPITVMHIIFGRDCSRLGHFKVLFCFTINLTAKVMKTEIKHWNLNRIHSRFQGSDLPSKSRAQDHIHTAQNLSWKTRLKGVVRWTIWMSKKIRQGCQRFLTISDPRWDQPISDIFI